MRKFIRLIPPSISRPNRSRPWGRAFFLYACLASALGFCLFVSPARGTAHTSGNGSAHLPEVGDVMERMDDDFGVLVKAVVIGAVQNLVSDTPYAVIAERADAIAEAAGILPKTEAFREDAALIAGSLELARAARGLAAAAKTQKIDAVARAFFQLHGTCVRCHEESRF